MWDNVQVTSLEGAIHLANALLDAPSQEQHAALWETLYRYISDVAEDNEAEGLPDFEASL